MRLSPPRSIFVAIRLLPFIVSLIRDWRRFIFFGPPRHLTSREHRRRAIAIRDTMAELGPSFIKAAQVLAMREDIVMPVYTRELKKLQDRVPPFPFAQVKELLRQNYGKPVGEVFDHIEPRPIAAASLGQVHAATWRGKKVAVKVLRPGVEELVRTDLTVVKWLIYIVRAFVDDNLVRSFTAIISEFERMIFLEMDFRLERKNADRIRSNFEDDDRVHIPQFIVELCTRQVAVIEYVDGVRVDQVSTLESVNVKPADFVNHLIETYIRMAVIHGFIHADPHPGNLLVDSRGRLVILDFGMCLEFSDETRLELLKIVYAVTRRDIDAIVDGFYRLGMVDEDINRGVIREAAQNLLNIQLTQDLTPRQVAEIAQEIIDTFYKFPLRLPNNLVYLLRAASLVEGIALQFDPKFNGVRTATPIVKKLLVEVPFSGKKPLKDRVIDGALQTVATVRQLATVIGRMEREQLRLRVHEADILEIERFLAGFLRRLFIGFGMLGVALLLGLAAIYFTNVILLISALVVLTILYIVVIFVPMPRGRRGGKPYFK